MLCVPLTGNLKWADTPGNVLLKANSTGLPQDSVANVSLLVALDMQRNNRRDFLRTSAAVAGGMTGVRPGYGANIKRKARPNGP